MTANYKRSFLVDEANSHEDDFIVDMLGIGTVVVRKQDDGVSVYLLDADGAKGCVAETWAIYADLISDDDGPDPDEQLEQKEAREHTERWVGGPDDNVDGE